jgi:hypothetical protein
MVVVLTPRNVVLQYRVINLVDFFIAAVRQPKALLTRFICRSISMLVTTPVCCRLSLTYCRVRIHVHAAVCTR